MGLLLVLFLAGLLALVPRLSGHHIGELVLFGQVLHVFLLILVEFVLGLALSDFLGAAFLVGRTLVISVTIGSLVSGLLRDV